ncbi:hypothetical protein WN55_01092 [Dufourea novaeangliae]|uniref:Uncharacterized protein n=1 Tax=Dufourea novaeangliae TaxID=178035 RepID=A0A154PE01_DUFNO|nr:hypothetical protein WN55_01092 [Dufourea novaeangliae]
MGPAVPRSFPREYTTPVVITTDGLQASPSPLISTKIGLKWIRPRFAENIL